MYNFNVVQLTAYSNQPLTQARMVSGVRRLVCGLLGCEVTVSCLPAAAWSLANLGCGLACRQDTDPDMEDEH